MKLFDEISKEYNAFVKMVVTDYPYELTFNENELKDIFTKVYLSVCDQHSQIDNKFFSKAGTGFIDFCFLDHYLIFCYRLANFIFKESLNLELANAIYYSSKVRTSTDLFYTAEIGDYFMPAHSIGAVIDSRAKYGYLLKIYNGVHIGPNNILGKKPTEWVHPKFGNGVTLLANSSVYGATEIGDNVIISANALIVNEIIPSNCIVLGQSPNLYVLPLTKSNFDILNLVQ